VNISASGPAGSFGAARGCSQFLASTIHGSPRTQPRPAGVPVSGHGPRGGGLRVCTFWLAGGLVWTGQGQQARGLMDQAVQLCSDVGLPSGQINPATGEFRSTLPLGVSHLALISAADTLGRQGGHC
jgi:hypothetical protein